MSKWLSGWAEFRTSVAPRLASLFFVTEYQESRILGVRMDLQKQSFKWPFLVHKIYIVRRKISLDFATLIPSLCYACLHCMALPCTKLHCITVLPWIMWYCTRWSPNSDNLCYFTAVSTGIAMPCITEYEYMYSSQHWTVAKVGTGRETIKRGCSRGGGRANPRIAHSHLPLEVPSFHRLVSRYLVYSDLPNTQLRVNYQENNPEWNIHNPKQLEAIQPQSRTKS